MMRKLLGLVLFSITLSVSYSQVYHNEWIDYTKTYYKFKVFGFGTNDQGAPISKGMVRIPYATLAANGLAGTSGANFQLWRDGEEVPLYISNGSGPLGSSDYIEFWGEINNGKLDKELYRKPSFQLNEKWSLQTDTAAYFLTVSGAANNKRFVNTANNVAANTLPPVPYFMHTVGRYFRNFLADGFSAVVGKNLYSSSYDLGEGYASRPVLPENSPCDGTAQLPQGFNNLYPYLSGPDMRLHINSFGSANNSRTVKVLFNSDSLTRYQMDYFYDAKIDEYVPVAKIAGNSAGVTLINESQQECDAFSVATIELTYPRTFNMKDFAIFYLTLDEAPTQGRYIEFTNFTLNKARPVIYDIANGKRYLGDTTETGKVKLVLEPSAVPYQLVISTQAGNYYKEMTSLQKRNFVDYSNLVNQGDYLIISNALIYGSGSNNYVEQYRQYRSSDKGGRYVAQVADIDQLVDQFAWGVKKHPLSVKNFLKYARDKFAVAPKFAFLIGKGVSYNEYKPNESNPLIDQMNLVPTFGYPASDNLLSSDNLTAIPATPIGRLSVVTPQEVGDYLQKVKQYDSVQQSPVQTIKDKGWMKNVLQIAGAGDLSLGIELDAYLLGYKNIITQTPFGARVINYSKTDDPSHYTEAVASFKNTYENGASLITYFGHSSSTNLDFNLDNPENYNNRFKYPVFIANGCSAGDHFNFEENRFNNKTTISEKFVLANQRGAIGYLASSSFGVPNYLDSFTRKFYMGFAGAQYNRSIGEAIKEGIAKVFEDAGYDDYFARVHAEEYAYHGDPAIKLNASPLPDYVIEEPQIEVNPSFVSMADTSFNVKVRINNIGKAAYDSVNFKLERKFPSGKLETLSAKKIASVNLVDSVIVQVPIIGSRDMGENILTASIDYDNVIPEISDENNISTKTVVVSEDEIRPVSPYAFAVISQPDFKLSASTVNPLNVSRGYIMEIDTTELFNSPQKVIKTKVSTGGVIEFDPGFSYKDGTTYYWRVAPANLAVPHWRVSSFVFKNGAAPGFQQGHLYQNFKSGLTNLTYDSLNGKYRFTNNAHNLFVVHSIYPYSGTEDNQFSISVDGNSIIRSACVGSSVIFNVFDPITFQPAKNTTNPFDAGAPCSDGREYNFEYSYLTAATRKNAANFLDAIPKGSFVAVRLILDQPYEVFAPDWANDTTIYGKNTLYSKLKDNGFTNLDSFNRPRTFAFIFKKGDSSFAPITRFSDGVYDRITLSQDCVTPNTHGVIASPKFGPSKGWKKVSWKGYSEETGNDTTSLDVIGSGMNNVDTVLYSLNNTQHDFDISAIDPLKYPFIKLRLNSKDSVTVTPYQLTSWNLEYNPAPEGGIAPNIYLNIPDTVNAPGSLHRDTLQIGVAYKNVSKVNFDSLTLKLFLIDTLNNRIEIPMPKTKALAVGDTLQINTVANVGLLQGLYTVYVQVNPNGMQYEEESFNNFLYKSVYILPGAVLPVTVTNFNAYLAGNNVKTSWTVHTETGVDNYIVQHSTNGNVFMPIGKLNAVNNGSTVSNYEFVHANAPLGKNYYRLAIADKDGSSKLSAVRLVTVAKGVSINIYPNPVKDKLMVVFNNQNGKPGVITLINAFGQRLLQKTINGTVTIDMEKYAAGTYILQADDGETVRTYKVQKQ